ncbi:1-deoxy-D-xylulose-5-phosphate synthase [Clostridium sp. USBA 49]|jgi:1-deoxy-D-xylulose-5-phosphate synthase|uniref:1-deoxy-D-xylulose-5-phosphate synthase n=1 Tax=Clostridium TaxID=1485 RepID=UPI0009996862|nr:MULTISPECIES: 1-deoxy-D-xylulose-5-phosphate synthase [Clostridium]SKA76767.1 1-deoxy-D-xylulose-5-phosphate synthase [Clostridium sp. USBA 49]
MYKILDNYKDFNDIKNMNFTQLDQFAQEIRQFLIDKVSKTGGHLASNLGVVELTLSLYNVFDFNKDKLIWDVGHQSYVHKILTGRKDKFDSLRKFGGISGFPKREESIYDMFETGHSSTSISAALGMARARDLYGKKYEVIAVIGDGALTGGMALEALNDAGYKRTKIIIILNDNEMSIGKNVGGLSTYLSKIRIDPKYNRFKQEIDSTLRKIPSIGKGMANSIERIKGGIKQVIVPSMIFEDMGIKYLGPINGHNIKDLSKVMSMARTINGPVIIHTVTQKGKGYKHAEENPDRFHGIGPFNCDSGEICSKNTPTYSSAFGNSIVELASDNKNIVAITAAMKDGTGLSKFAMNFPDRFFDVGIAEQHAVTMAAGMASEGLRPIFAVYSTFLQRAYDQILHDVCIQKLPVIFAIDRAGIVGEDGETHQGIFDLSYLSHIPNITIMTPKCIDEIRYMLKWALNQNYPIAIRYPRGGDNYNVKLTAMKDYIKGKWEIVSTVQNKNINNTKIAIIASGKMVQNAILVKENLKEKPIDIIIVNACFIKPIDKGLIKKLVENNYNIVTIEDNIVHGGLGSLVIEYIATLSKDKNIKILNLGFKDEFITHGSVDILYKLYGLDVDGITKSILKII